MPVIIEPRRALAKLFPDCFAEVFTCAQIASLMLFVAGQVEAVFRVQREGEDERLQNCGVDRHMLLFHGSSSYNLISILGQGLLVAPSFVPLTGSIS